MTKFAPEMQVKQYVCEIPGPYCKFRVFETGNSKFYLFVALDPSGCDRGLHIPIAKSRLSVGAKRWIRANYRKTTWKKPRKTAV